MYLLECCECISWYSSEKTAEVQGMFRIVMVHDRVSDLDLDAEIANVS
jgi:hypothetical protein